MKSFAKLSLPIIIIAVLAGCGEVTEDGVVIDSTSDTVITVDIETEGNTDESATADAVDTADEVAPLVVAETAEKSNELVEELNNDNVIEIATPDNSNISVESLNNVETNIPLEPIEETNTGDQTTTGNVQIQQAQEEQEQKTKQETKQDNKQETEQNEMVDPESEQQPIEVTEITDIENGIVSSAYLAQTEVQLTNTPLMQSVKASIETLDNTLVELISALSSSNPNNVKRVESFLSENDWDYIFPERAVEYSYENFLKAIGKFPAFCGDYNDGRDSDTICRKSLATMFAHFTQETGGHTEWWDVPQWRQGLVHIREMGWDEKMRGGYNGECNLDVWQGQTWPCGTFDDGEYKSYFGRGAKQLSYNYNYGPFSQAMFGDVSVLLNAPERVADTWLNLASAIFFYVYPQPPKPSMLHVIDGTWQPNERDILNGLVIGFGVTTQIINGGVECGGSTEIAQSLNRISYYQSFANYLGVAVQSSEVLGCANMKQFDSQGSGALNIYWEQNWDYIAENIGGASFACKLVGYQTPFSVFKEGDYSSCVQHYFDVVVE